MGLALSPSKEFVMPNKAQVESKVKALIADHTLDYNDVVVMGPSAVFALAGVAEDYSNTIVVGTTATNYAKLRSKFKEINGYDGIYLDVDGVMVQEGLPLSTETHSRIKCIALSSLSVRLQTSNKQAFEVLDKWIKAELAKKLRVKPELRLGYLTLDEQLEYQDILEHRGRQLNEEEQFVIEVSSIDWSHQMSDDNRCWRAGEEHRKSLIQKAEDKFGPGTTLAKKFTDICQWGFNGYSQLKELYPWLAGYQAGQRKHFRGMMAAAMEGVSEEYVAELRGRVVMLDRYFAKLPTQSWYGYFVYTDATPPLFKMREAAKDQDSPALYGITVREDARIGLNDYLKKMTRQQIEDISKYGILGKYTDSMYQWSLFPSEVFSSLSVLEIRGSQGRTFRFMLDL